MCTSAFQRALLANLALACASVLALTSATALAQSFDKGLGGLGKSPLGSQGPVDPLSVSAKSNRQALVGGDQAVIAVVLEFAPHWHAWPSATQDVLPPEVADFAIRTEIALVEKPEWIAKVGPVQWPKPLPAPVPDLMNPGQSIEVPVYQGRAIAFIPIVLAESIDPGETSVHVSVYYQACDESQCLAPEEIIIEAPVRLVGSIGEAASIGSGEADADFESFDPTMFARMHEGTAADTDATLDPELTPRAAPIGSSFFGVSLGELTGPLGFVLLALFGAIGGFVLNLTPCVLPVIPIKVMTLTKHAGSPGRSLFLGSFMAAGVIAFWLALGVPAAFVSSLADPSRLFGIWWVTAGIGLIIGLMGLGIMGLFMINLPQKVYMLNPEADSAGGSFMFGVMTAVLGLPCFGFVAGALLPAAAAIGPASTITVFGSMGVGMAAPYLVLSARPSLVEKLPRTGPASDLVKQVMGLLLLAAAAYFIGSGLIALTQDYPFLAKRLHWWVVALFGAASGGWLVLRTFQITTKAQPRILFSILGFIMAGSGILVAVNITNSARTEYAKRLADIGDAGPGQILTTVWNDYSDALVSEALAQDKIVVLDFTAEWCLNCKALKAAVLNVAPVRPALEADDVVMVKVDLTSTKAPGWDKLRDYGQTGIPTLVIQAPGPGEPWVANAYSSEQVMTALARARGERGEAPVAHRATSSGR